MQLTAPLLYYFFQKVIMMHPPLGTIMFTLNRKEYIHVWGLKQQAWPLGGRKTILLLRFAIY